MYAFILWILVSLGLTDSSPRECGTGIGHPCVADLRAEVR